MPENGFARREDVRRLDSAERAAAKTNRNRTSDERYSNRATDRCREDIDSRCVIYYVNCHDSKKLLITVFSHRLKGNEFFRSAEYKWAVSEYTKSLKFLETAAAFNNRAAACRFFCVFCIRIVKTSSISNSQTQNWKNTLKRSAIAINAFL